MIAAFVGCPDLVVGQRTGTRADVLAKLGLVKAHFLRDGRGNHCDSQGKTDPAKYRPSKY